MNNKRVRRITYTAMFLALAFILPFVTMQIPSFGQMLTPMHFPVIIAAIILGPTSGVIVGLIAPLLRSTMLGLPPMPMALSMAVELAMYALVIGVMLKVLKKAKVSYVIKVIISLIIAMVIGRISFALAAMVFMNAPDFMSVFIATFTDSFVGIILQLILIPLIVIRLDN